MRYARLIFLLLFATISTLLAADPLAYADSGTGGIVGFTWFPVIVFGEPTQAKNVFQFTASLAKSFADGGPLFLIGIFLMGFAAIKAVYRNYKDFALSKLGFDYIWAAVIAFLMLTPASTVHVFDGRFNQSSKVVNVDGVPYLIAATASVTTVLTATLMDIVQDASNNISVEPNLKFGNLGLGTPVAFALKAIEKVRLDSNITSAYDRFNRECIVPASIGAEMTDYIMNHKDDAGSGVLVFNQFQNIRNLVDNLPELANKQMSDQTTCGTFVASNFNPSVEGNITNSINTTLKSMGYTSADVEALGTNAAKNFGMSDLPDFNRTDTQFANFIGYIKNYKLTQAIAQSQENQNMAAFGGTNSSLQVSNIMAAASLGNLQTSGIGNWRGLQQIVPMAHTFILTVLWGLAWLMGYRALLLGVAESWGLFKEYLTGLASFSLVSISFVLVDNWVLGSAQTDAQSILANGENPASLYHVAQHLEYLATMQGMTGALGLAVALIIPGIIISGKTMAAMGVLGSAGSMAKSGTARDALKEDAEIRAWHEQQVRIERDASMRATLKGMGFNVGPNTDVGVMYNEIMSAMNEEARGYGAAAALSRNNAQGNFFDGAAAQSAMQTANVVGTGRQASAYNGYGALVAASEAKGALDLEQKVAEGRALLARDDQGRSVVGNDGRVTDTAQKGIDYNANKNAGQILGIGIKASELGDDATRTAHFAGEKAGYSAVAEDHASAKMYNFGLRNGSNIKSDATPEQIQTAQAEQRKAEADASGYKKTAEKFKALGKKKYARDIEHFEELARQAEARADKANDYIQRNKEINSMGSISAADVVTMGATKKIQSEIGAASGIAKVLSKNGQAYAENAAYSEASQALSTQAKLAAIGSIDKALNVDTLLAGKQASESMAGAKAFGQVFGGMDDILKAMQQGGTDVASKITEAFKSFSGVAEAGAHKGYESQVGDAKGYRAEQGKYGTDYQAKIAESSIRQQAESGMQAIKGIQDHYKAGESQAIATLGVQAGRQSYVQARSTAQDITEKDKAFGAKGYEESALDVAYKQTHEGIGATRGIRHVKSGRGVKAFEDVAQSGIETQVESGLGAIRGAKGIHALATQSGIKAESDSNALRLSIQTAGGGQGYIAMNALEAVANTSATLAAQNKGQEAGGYVKLKALGAEQDILAKAATQRAGVHHGLVTKGGDHVSQDGWDSLKSQADVKAGQVSAELHSREMIGVIAPRGTIGGGLLNERGIEAINNQAIANALAEKGESQKRQQALENIDSGIANKVWDQTKMLNALGMTEEQYKNGQMNDAQYAKYIGMAEKRMDQKEIQGVNDRGQLVSMSFRSSFAPEANGGKGQWTVSAKNADGQYVDHGTARTWNGQIISFAQKTITDTLGQDASDNATKTWGGYKEIVAGAAVGAAGFAWLRKAGDLTQTRPAKSQPNLAAPTNMITPTTNSTASIMQSSLSSHNPIIAHNANLLKTNLNELSGLHQIGAGGIYRQEVGGSLARQGHTSLANKVLSGANVTADDFSRAGVDPKQYGLTEKLFSDTAKKTTVKGLDFQTAGMPEYQAATAKAEAKVASSESALKSAVEKETLGGKIRTIASKVGLENTGKIFTSGGSGFYANGGRLLGVASIGYEAYNTGKDASVRYGKGDTVGGNLEVAKGVLSIGGGLIGAEAGATGGAVAGAAIGSVVPVVGTAAGAVVGGVVGAIAGGMGGGWAGSSVGQSILDEYDANKHKQAEKPQVASMNKGQGATPPPSGNGQQGSSPSAQGNVPQQPSQQSTFQGHTPPSAPSGIAQQGSIAQQMAQAQHPSFTAPQQPSQQSTFQGHTPPSAPNVGAASNASTMAHSIVSNQNKQTSTMSTTQQSSGSSQQPSQDQRHNGLFDNISDSLQRFAERLNGIDTFKAHRADNPISFKNEKYQPQERLVPDMQQVRQKMYAGYMHDENIARSINPRQQMFDTMTNLRNSGSVSHPPQNYNSGSLSSLTTALSFRQAAVQDRQASDTRESMLLNAQMQKDIWQLGKSFRDVHREQLEQAKREAKEG